MTIETAVRVWMRRVLDEKDWSAEHWARVAGTSATNISRYLAKGENLPTLRTMAKLAAAAGSWPDMRGGAPAIARPTTHAPLVEPQHAEAAMAGVPARRGPEIVPVMGGASDRAVAVMAGGSLGFTAGHPGDMVVIEPRALLHPRAGDLVMVQHGDEFSILGYGDPILTDRGRACCSLNSVDVIGVAVQILSKCRANDMPT